MNTLLVAQISKDPLVLLKLIGTIEPTHLLVISTAYAKQEGWENIITMSLTGEKSVLEHTIENITFIEINDNSSYDNIWETLDKKWKNTAFEYENVYVDVTTGIGLYRTLLLEFFRRVSEKNKQTNFNVSYVDGKKRVLRILKNFNGVPIEENRSLTISFLPTIIANRLKPYNLNINPRFTTIFEDNKYISRNLHHNIEKIRTHFLQNRYVRELLRSYVEIGKEHLFLTRSQELDPRFYHKEYLLFKENIRNTLRKKMVTNFDFLLDRIDTDIVGFFGNLDISVKSVIKKHHRENGIQYLNTVIKNAILESLNAIEIGRNKFKDIRMLLFSETLSFTAKLQGLVKTFIEDEIEENTKIIKGKVSFKNPLLTKAIHRYCLKYKIMDVYNLFDNSSIPDIMEDLVSYETIHYLESDPTIKTQVKGIYAGIVFKEMELDTTILLTSGDIIAIETKTHFISAKKKDMDARTKNLRDYTGGYSDLYLVLPFLKNELQSIMNKDFRYNDQRKKQGISDTIAMRNFLIIEKNSNGRKIIGFDEISNILKSL